MIPREVYDYINSLLDNSGFNDPGHKFCPSTCVVQQTRTWLDGCEIVEPRWDPDPDALQAMKEAISNDFKRSMPELGYRSGFAYNPVRIVKELRNAGWELRKIEP